MFVRPIGRRRTRSAADPGVAGRCAGPHERLGSHVGNHSGLATIPQRTLQPASPPHTPGQDRRGTSRRAEVGCGGLAGDSSASAVPSQRRICLPQAAKASAPSAPALRKTSVWTRGQTRTCTRSHCGVWRKADMASRWMQRFLRSFIPAISPPGHGRVPLCSIARTFLAAGRCAATSLALSLRSAGDPRPAGLPRPVATVQPTVRCSSRDCSVFFSSICS